MRLVVAGGGDRVGTRLLDQALGHGHVVVALSDPVSVGLSPERLEAAPTDLLDSASVDQRLAGADAVVLLCAEACADPTLADGTAALVRGAVRQGVRRMVVVAPSGTGADQGRLSRALSVLTGETSQARSRREQLESAETELFLSDLEWTLVRPADVTGGAATGEYRVVEGATVPRGRRISAADLAGLALKVAETRLYSRRIVAIAY